MQTEFSISLVGPILWEIIIKITEFHSNHWSDSVEEWCTCTYGAYKVHSELLSNIYIFLPLRPYGRQSAPWLWSATTGNTTHRMMHHFFGMDILVIRYQPTMCCWLVHLHKHSSQTDLSSLDCLSPSCWAARKNTPRVLPRLPCLISSLSQYLYFYQLFF